MRICVPASRLYLLREYRCTWNTGPAWEYSLPRNGSVPTGFCHTRTLLSVPAAAGYAQQRASIAAPSSRTWCARCIVRRRADGRRWRRRQRGRHVAPPLRRHSTLRDQAWTRDSRERVYRSDVSADACSRRRLRQRLLARPDVVTRRTTHSTLTRRRTAANAADANSEIPRSAAAPLQERTSGSAGHVRAIWQRAHFFHRTESDRRDLFFPSHSIGDAPRVESNFALVKVNSRKWKKFSHPYKSTIQSTFEKISFVRDYFSICFKIKF